MSALCLEAHRAKKHIVTEILGPSTLNEKGTFVVCLIACQSTTLLIGHPFQQVVFWQAHLIACQYDLLKMTLQDRHC